MVRSACLLVVAACAATSGCAPPPPDGTATRAATAFLTQETPPGAAPGTCWGKEITPAIIETVTDQILVQAEKTDPDGTVTAPAIYKTETRQAIVTAREETFFESLCPAAFTDEFVASLQRALQARDLYRGPITGRMDAQTEAAIRRFQTETGPASGILSRATAQRLGLVTTPTKS